MRVAPLRAFASVLALAACASPAAWGLAPSSTLYQQHFDVDDSHNWTINRGNTDGYADFHYDYSTVGIPPAPHSAGTTRGLQLQANLLSNIFGGVSISPIVSPLAGYGGDYVLRFDWWSNYLGNDLQGVGAPGVGSTMLSTFGVLTSGQIVNQAGQADGVFFAVTGDGGSGADFRAYSPERPVSYQSPPQPGFEELDGHATYFAGSRNNTAPYYVAAFPGGAIPPAEQFFAFPFTQHGMTPAGVLGFAWHEVELEKLGGRVIWRIDGVDLIAVDLAEQQVPFGGDNILFGHADINAGTNLLTPDFLFLQFTLIDNVRVERIPEPTAAMTAILAAIGGRRWRFASPHARRRGRQER